MELSKSIFLSLFDPSSFNCSNLTGIRLITQLHLELSHLHEDKFNCNFQNCLNVLCSCGFRAEPNSHFLLHCSIFTDHKNTLLSILNNINCKILDSPDSFLMQNVLFGSILFDTGTKTLIVNATIDYISSSE